MKQRWEKVLVPATNLNTLQNTLNLFKESAAVVEAGLRN